MRLGKREREERRFALAQAQAMSRARSFAPAPVCAEGKYASAWSRFFPVLRPVAITARVAWETGLTRGKRANTCPQGWPREPDFS